MGIGGVSLRSERGVNRGWIGREAAEGAKGAEGKRKGRCPGVRAVVVFGYEVGD